MITCLGAGLGFLGGSLGRIATGQWLRAPFTRHRDLVRRSRQRSLVIGAIASLILALRLYFEGFGEVGHQLTLICLSTGFILSLVYVSAWVLLTTNFGAGPVEACELGLLISAVLVALLYVCGILWITLVIIGSSVLIAAFMLGGLCIYRFR
jgi:hypothetical protein